MDAVTVVSQSVTGAGGGGGAEQAPDSVYVDMEVTIGGESQVPGSVDVTVTVPPFPLTVTVVAGRVTVEGGTVTVEASAVL